MVKMETFYVFLFRDKLYFSNSYDHVLPRKH